MTYSEIQDRLNRVESALTALNSGNYDTLSQDYSQQSISQLQEIQTQLKEQLTLIAEEEDGSVVTDSPEDAEKLAKKGVRVKLTNEQDKASFDINETKAIAVATGKALQKSLKSLGDEVSRMKATNIEPSSFEVKVEFKNGNEDEFSFYINEDDALHLVDFSFDKELTDVGVKPSGEAVVNVDVLANALTNHFKSANETTEEMQPKDQEFEKAKEADRLNKHPESETIKAIYDLMQNANSMEEASTLKDVEHKLATCPVGCIATGGGYGPFRKISKNSWKGKAGLQHSQALASLIGGFEDFNIDESHCNSTHEELAELFGNDIFDNRPHGETEFMGVKINKDKEDKEDKKPLKEFTSTGKLTGHEDFKFLATQLTQLCDKSNAKDCLRILMSVGELGLDLGYAEANSDAEMAAAHKPVNEDRFVAAAFEDLEQVIRNLAHTAEISEDEAIEMAIRKLEAMLDGRDDMDESVASTSRDLDKCKADIKTHLQMYKDAEGDKAKKAAIQMLKQLNDKKKALVKDLESKVAGTGKGQELN
jgi:hypothetical protein